MEYWNDHNLTLAKFSDCSLMILMTTVCGVHQEKLNNMMYRSHKVCLQHIMIHWTKIEVKSTLQSRGPLPNQQKMDGLDYVYFS
jgi:hypothetical protein